MWSGSLDLFFSIYYMAIQTCGPRVPAHDNRGMSIEWPGSHACTHRERGPQSDWVDFTKLIWDFNYAFYKAVYVHTKLVWQNFFFTFRLGRNDYQDIVVHLIGFESE